MQDSMLSPPPEPLRVRYRIYKLSAQLMKFYIARKPTFESRSLILELASIRFSYQKSLFELPLKEVHLPFVCF